MDESVGRVAVHLSLPVAASHQRFRLAAVRQRDDDRRTAVRRRLRHRRLHRQLAPQYRARLLPGIQDLAHLLQLAEHKARGEVLRNAALAWIDGPDAKGQRLLYLQYMEPHTPLSPPPAQRARFAPGVSNEEAGKLNEWARTAWGARAPLPAEEMQDLFALYDAEVAAVDEEISRLFDALEKHKIFDRALVIVTADHGEEFLEHGNFGHGFNLFNTTVHVPLIIAGPGIAAGAVVNENVSLVDVAPTVLELTGGKPEPRFEGRSLVPLLRDGAKPSVSQVDIVLQLPRVSSKWDLRVHKDGLLRGPEKLLVSNKGVGEFYDLSQDPDEKNPAGSPAGAALQAALDADTSRLAARQQPQAEKVVVDEATKEKLRALGYHP